MNNAWFKILYSDHTQVYLTFVPGKKCKSLGSEISLPPAPYRSCCGSQWHGRDDKHVDDLDFSWPQFQSSHGANQPENKKIESKDRSHITCHVTILAPGLIMSPLYRAHYLKTSTKLKWNHKCKLTPRVFFSIILIATFSPVKMCRPSLTLAKPPTKYFSGENPVSFMLHIGLTLLIRSMLASHPLVK